MQRAARAECWCLSSRGQPLARFMLFELHVRQMELSSMKLNPYAVLLTTGVLMLATVVFAQTGPTVSMIRAKVAARHAEAPPYGGTPPQGGTHLASVDREPATNDSGGHRTLKD